MLSPLHFPAIIFYHKQQYFGHYMGDRTPSQVAELWEICEFMVISRFLSLIFLMGASFLLAEEMATLPID